MSEIQNELFRIGSNVYNLDSRIADNSDSIVELGKVVDKLVVENEALEKKVQELEKKMQKAKPVEYWAVKNRGERSWREFGSEPVFNPDTQEWEGEKGCVLDHLEDDVPRKVLIEPVVTETGFEFLEKEIDE